jgi:hypothetical protein
MTPRCRRIAVLALTLAGCSGGSDALDDAAVDTPDDAAIDAAVTPDAGAGVCGDLIAQGGEACDGGTRAW